MRRIDYFFRETATGLRRNGTMAFAAMSTAFIALFLFGLALMIQREFRLWNYAVTGNVEVAVYLSDPVNPDTVGQLTTTLQRLTAVESVTYETKDQACARFRQEFPRLYTENTSCDVIPASLRVHLTDTALYPQIPAALGCSAPANTNDKNLVCTAPGVRTVYDNSATLSRISALTNNLSIAVLFIAFLMLGSAIALVANTLRMGMFARRKEIGIMRLVGATNWRIRIPFLIEGLVESLLGAAAAVLVLFLVKVVFVERLGRALPFIPIVRTSDLITIVPWIAIAGAGVALIAGTIGMRRFLDV